MNMKEKLSALVQEGLAKVLDCSLKNIEFEWLKFCSTNSNEASKLCFAMRKQGDVAAIASYYLAKALYNLDNKKNLNVFAWCALSAVKAFRAEGVANKVDYSQDVTNIVKELVSLNIKPVTQYDQILVDQILHYKTVCLASEDHLAEAFETWRRRYREDTSIENLKKLGWTLYDCLKQSTEVLANRKLVEFFASELRRLKYPPEMDALLVNQTARALQNAENFLNGTGEVLALLKGNERSTALSAAEHLVKEQPENVAAHLVLAGIYDKIQHFRASLREYCLANKLEPENERAQDGAAWALVRFINNALKDGWLPTYEKLWPTDNAANRVREDDRWNKSESKVVYNGLTCLNMWKLLKRPSLVYSQLLRAYTRVVKSVGKDVPLSLAEGYFAFVKEWDLANLTDDDWKPYIPKDKPQSSYPSLAENVVSALYRCATIGSRDGRSLIKENSWVIDYIGHAVEKFSGQQWYPYYYGKLLVELERFEDARGYIIKIAQRKMSEFWVWQMLAETYPDNQDRQLVCLCRAALCKAKDESYLVSVHEMLGKLLKDRGLNAEALCEFHKVDALRAAKKWKAVVRGPEFLNWSKNVTAVRDNVKLYHQWAEKADAIVFENLPSIEAIVTARYRDRNQNEEIAKVWSSGVKREIPVKVKKFQILQKAVPGMPIRIWLDTDGGRDMLLKVESRDGGQPWDVYPKQSGVLVAQDTRHGSSLFVIGEKGETCFEDWRKCKDLRDIALGTVGELVVFARPDGRSYVRYVAFPDNPVLPPFAKAYSGTLRIPEGRNFGFVGDIFAAEDVVGSVENGSSVTGIATRSHDRTKNRIGWKAVTLRVN